MIGEARGASVLVITTMAEARKRGAAFGTCRHRDRPGVQFWWSGLGRGMLDGREFDVVIIGVELDDEMRDWLRASQTRRGRVGTIITEGQLW